MRDMRAKITKYAAFAAGLFALCLLVFLWETAHLDFSRFPASEASAVGSLRTIYSANRSYAAAHTEQGYAKNLSDLSSAADAKHQDQQGWTIDTALATGVKSAYKFTYTAHSSSGTARLDKYEVFADPLKTNRSGKHFFVDESGVIRWSETGSASLKSSTLQ